jgi:hypothetical protein
MKVCWVLLFVFAVAVCEEGTDADPISKAKSSENQGDVKQRTKLFRSLIEDYERTVNPDNADVRFGVSLINVDIDEVKSTLESNVWLKYTWKDSRLQWDAKEWKIDVLRASSSNFWKPDIQLYNGADLSRAESQCWDSNVLVYPDGKVLWVPPCHFSSFCKNTLKISPYAPQTCFLKFGSWTYDSDIMDINLYQNQTSIDTSDFWDLSNWTVQSTSGEKNIKFYSCCPEPYADLTFNITLQKKSEVNSLCAI